MKKYTPKRVWFERGFVSLDLIITLVISYSSCRYSCSQRRSPVIAWKCLDNNATLTLINPFVVFKLGNWGCDGESYTLDTCSQVFRFHLPVLTALCRLCVGQRNVEWYANYIKWTISKSVWLISIFCQIDELISARHWSWAIDMWLHSIDN